MSLYRNVVWFVKGMREYTKSGFEAASASFNATELDNLLVTGRNVVVTGANSGIGLVCCKELARRGANVHMVCRNRERGEAARLEVVQAAGCDNQDSNTNQTAKVELHLLDMSQPRSVAKFAATLASQVPCVDVLVNNAGCMVNELTLDSDGLEANFATNTLGTYLLTEGLIDALGKAKDPRVIVVSSGGMLVQKLNHDDPMLTESHARFDGTMFYAQNKRQQVVMTEVWADRYPKIFFASMHPGWADTPAVASSMPSFYNSMQGRLRTPEQGADTVVWLALSPTVKSTASSGDFFQDRRSVGKHLRFARTHSTALEKQQFMNRLAELAKRYQA